jgi:hypothetical protein
MKIDQWLETLDAFEANFIPDIVKAKSDFIDKVALNAFRTKRVTDEDFAEHIKDIKAVLQKHANRHIRFYGQRTSENILSQRKSLEYKFSEWGWLVAAWINEFGFQKAQGIAQTTKNDITDAIQINLAEQEAVSEQALIEDILKVKAFSPFRAATIARTETHAAATYAAGETAKYIASETGIKVKKRWSPALDERTRISHAAMAGKPAIGLSEKFVVNGEKLERPGDPKGSPGNVINCRCGLVHDVVDI